MRPLSAKQTFKSNLISNKMVDLILPATDPIDERDEFQITTENKPTSPIRLSQKPESILLQQVQTP